MWFYITIIIAILVAHDLILKRMKNEVRLKELDIEMRKLELGKQSAEEEEGTMKEVKKVL